MMTTAFTLGGSIDDYADPHKQAIKQTLATAASVDTAAINLTLTAGSVTVVASIAMPSRDEADAKVSTLINGVLANAASLEAALKRQYEADGLSADSISVHSLDQVSVEGGVPELHNASGSSALSSNPNTTVEAEWPLLTSALVAAGALLACLLGVLCCGLCLVRQVKHLPKDVEFSEMGRPETDEDGAVSRTPLKQAVNGDEDVREISASRKGAYQERLARARHAARVSRARTLVKERLSPSGCVQARMPLPDSTSATPVRELGVRTRMPAPSPGADVRSPAPYAELCPEPDDLDVEASVPHASTLAPAVETPTPTPTGTALAKAIERKTPASSLAEIGRRSRIPAPSS